MLFSEKLADKEEKYLFTPEEISSFSRGDMLLFSFEIKAEKTAQVYITIGSKENISDLDGYEKTVRYTVPSQLSKIYMPLVCNELESVSIRTEGTVYITSASVENLKQTSHDCIQQKSGMWLAENFEYHSVTADTGAGIGGTIDLVKKNGYIYAIGSGRLTVIKADTMTVKSTLELTGTLRQAEITKDGNYLLVSCRQEGMLIINIQNPDAPYICARYDSVELATGLCVAENYAFICNRQYGIEIVDISDPCNPSHKGIIRSGEVQSCTVHNNILYAGVWGECGVYMYDLSSVDGSYGAGPVGRVSTNGKGDGLSVMDINGKTYLFAATGHHKTDCAPIEAPLSNLCYGQGNGFDIYDVTDPSNAFWVSGGHTDGRFYHSANDYWKTTVSHHRASNRYYMYLVNTYNGVFVYDITDIQAPVRLAQYSLVMPVCHKYPKLTHNTRSIITPWRQDTERRSPAGTAVTGDGIIYIGGTDSDLYPVECKYAFEPTEPQPNICIPNGYGQSEKEFDVSVSEFSYTIYKSDGLSQSYSFAAKDNTLYSAEGNGGVKIYEKDTMMLLACMPARNIGAVGSCVYDVAVCENRLFVAAGIHGLRIYNISGLSVDCPEPLHACEENCRTGVRQVVVAPGGNFVVIQQGTDSIKIVDIRNDAFKVVMTTGVGGAMLYHRQISAPVFDRYICYWSHNGIEHWLDFGSAENRLDIPLEVCSPFKDNIGGVGMFHGLCGFTHSDRKSTRLNSSHD